MATSDRRSGAAGGLRPREACTIDMESSTVTAVPPRGDEPEHPVHAGEQGLGRLLPKADSAVALDVGVAAQGADAGARPADVAAQQQEVGQLLDGGGRVAVLGQAHAVAEDDVTG